MSDTKTNSVPENFPERETEGKTRDLVVIENQKDIMSIRKVLVQCNFRK